MLGVTDIAEHLTIEGILYCAAVLDAFIRKIVGWTIGNSSSANLVTNALKIGDRITKTLPETVIHSDQGTIFRNLIFTEPAKSAGYLLSMGMAVLCYDCQSIFT